MAARFGPVAPGIFFSAGFPLPGNPPFADFDWVFGVFQVKDDHDRAAKAFGRR